MERPEWAQDSPRPKFQHKGDSFAPEVGKDRKQRTREKGKGTRDICPRLTKDWLWIESRQTHRQMAVYKGKGETPELVCFDRACKLG